MPGGSPFLLALLGLATAAALRSRAGTAETEGRSDDDADDTTRNWSAGGFGGGFGGLPLGGLGGGFVVDLGDLFQTHPPGAVVSGGLAELIEQLQAAGHGEAAQSWVSDAPSQPIGPSEIEHALDEDLLGELERRTGLTRGDLVERLATELPQTVDHLTPQGRVPTATEAEEFIVGPDYVELKEPGS